LDKKGSDILLLDLRDEAIFTDYFLICNGESRRQLKSLADGISEEAKEKADVKPWGQEGEPESGWVLIDYGDLVVHLFNPDTRHYYDLEDLWQNAHVVLRMQ
jgi:ribosome-associated protein